MSHVSLKSLRTVTLTGLGLLAAACAGDSIAPREQPTVSLIILFGNGQSGPVGTELLNPIVIKAIDSRGKLVPGITVNFRVISGGGSVFAGAALTDSKGIAQDYWTLGTSTTAPQVVEVRAVSTTGEKQVFGTFTANAVAGAATSVSLHAGNGQIAPRGTAVPIPPAVLVRDQYGNPVPNHPVAFTVAGGGGSVTGGSALTNSSGIASVGAWTLGTTVCPNSLSAMAGGAPIVGNPVAFNATGGDCWTSLAGMPTARQFLAGGVINGQVYAVGGYGGTPVGTLEIYNPANNTWSPRVSMPTPRYGLAAGVVDGRLYAMGGSSVNNGPLLNVVESYDPLSNAWTTRAPMPTPRRAFGIGVVGGILYAVGGFDPNGNSAVVEAYDPATDTWTTKAPMPTPRPYVAVGAANGILYAFGGYVNGVLGTVEAYDPVTNSWTPRAPMPTSREALSIGEMNGKLYAIGGGNATNAVEVYDPVTNSWTTGAPIIGGGRGYAFGGVANGVFYLVGGNDGSNWVGTVGGYVP